MNIAFEVISFDIYFIVMVGLVEHFLIAAIGVSDQLLSNQYILQFDQVIAVSLQ
jgi:hypothetical protein